MSKLYTENGFLSEYGEAQFRDLNKEINRLLNNAHSERETRLIGSLIQKKVGDLVGKYIAQAYYYEL